jgi:hypothetical protein
MQAGLGGVGHRARARAGAFPIVKCFRGGNRVLTQQQGHLLPFPLHRLSLCGAQVWRIWAVSPLSSAPAYRISSLAREARGRPRQSVRALYAGIVISLTERIQSLWLRGSSTCRVPHALPRPDLKRLPCLMQKHINNAQGPASTPKSEFLTCARGAASRALIHAREKVMAS